MRFIPSRSVTDDVIVTEAEARLLYIIRDLPLGSKPRSRVPPVPNLGSTSLGARPFSRKIRACGSRTPD